MQVFQVNSIPLKDVIISLAKSFGVTHHNSCEEYYLKVPSNLGSGEIRGITFENGLALMTYNVLFNTRVRLEFTLNEVHPVKFINSLDGPLIHEFADEGTQHEIDQYQCAIVASERKNGHVIEFAQDTQHEIVSIEIDRQIFSAAESCELAQWTSPLKDVLTDVEGMSQFYHIENCGVLFRDVLEDTAKFKKFLIARKLNLQSTTMQVFIHQIMQFDDDELHADKRTILRVHELKRLEELAIFIHENIADDHSIKNLSRKSGLNPSKLQSGFQHLFSMSVTAYLIHVRLEYAANLLKNNEHTVNEVVAAIGLENGSYFSKIFKEKYGTTPKKFQAIFS